MTDKDHPERRDEDRSHFWRAVHEVYEGWKQHVGVLAKTVTILGFMVTVGGGIAAGLVMVGVLKADYRGIPERVERHDARIDSLGRSFNMIESNTERLDSLTSTVSETRQNMREIRGQLRQLESGQEANKCWIMVAAGEESRFNCTP